MKTVETVQIIGDAIFETNEVFFVHLANARNARVLPEPAQGTIIDDDFKVRVAIPIISRLDDGFLSVIVRFLAVAGRAYRVEIKDDLFTDNWRILREFDAHPADREIEVNDLVRRSSRFYRVVAP